MNDGAYNTHSYISSRSTMNNMFVNPNYFFEHNTLQDTGSGQRNRFVYVNQNFINLNLTSKPKVLINPNFKPTVHINPKFQNPLKPSIHVNPNVINLKTTKSVITSTNQDCTTISLKDKNTIKVEPLVSTRTKLIRVSSGQNSQFVKNERRQSLHTKYKIVHCNGDIKNEFKSQENYLKNRYKIDKNVLPTKRSPRKENLKSKYKLQNASVNKKMLPTKYGRVSQSKYISINGTLYKKTPNVLKKADLLKITTGKTNISRNNVLLIRGQLYKLDHRQKRLKILSLSSCTPKLKGKESPVALKQKKLYKHKLNSSKQRISLSDFKNSANRILRNKMRKCNIPCPMYRKFGKCKANEMGKCIRVHNPHQISLCTR
ncbi:leucine zipper-ef-hand containing transmembrane protein [Holotrichia oblita]|nr:leucine zipper-ef-hand containing transmembrane protein [Holotrichia oblita]